MFLDIKFGDYTKEIEEKMHESYPHLLPFKKFPRTRVLFLLVIMWEDEPRPILFFFFSH